MQSVVLVLGVAACGTSDAPTELEAETLAAVEPAALRTRASRIFGALPTVFQSPNAPLTDAKIALGRTLYYDHRLSRNQTLSCNSCHDLQGYGIDTRPEAVERGTSFGHGSQFGGRNAPSVYNAALHITQFWDGRAPDVEEQAKGPILNPIEMNMPDEASVLRVIRSIPGYAPLFAAAFPGEADPITYDNVGKAIGAFERVLLTPSAFDDFLIGDEQALTQAQLEGLEEFLADGCASCHSGPLFGGTSYQKLGAAEPFDTDDPGRANVTGNGEDSFFFKVPSLRNVTKTGPYFHDGSIKTLEDAVKLMARHQSAVQLTDAQAHKIVTFLDALTGEIPRHRIVKPILPPSGPDTPPPDPY